MSGNSLTNKDLEYMAAHTWPKSEPFTPHRSMQGYGEVSTTGKPIPGLDDVEPLKVSVTPIECPKDLNRAGRRAWYKRMRQLRLPTL